MKKNLFIALFCWTFLLTSCQTAPKADTDPYGIGGSVMSWIKYGTEPINTSFQKPGHPQVSFSPYLVTNDNLIYLEASSEYLEAVSPEILRMQEEAIRSGRAEGYPLVFVVMEIGHEVYGNMPITTFSKEYGDPDNSYIVQDDIKITAKADLVDEENYVISIVSINNNQNGEDVIDYRFETPLEPGIYRVDITTDRMRKLEPKKRRVLYIRTEPYISGPDCTTK